jgi:hypothetical protein
MRKTQGHVVHIFELVLQGPQNPLKIRSELYKYARNFMKLYGNALGTNLVHYARPELVFKPVHTVG